MGWDWVKILKEEMLDLKPDEHLSRHAATDRLAWVSSQAPARAPMPAEDYRDFGPSTPPAGGALLGWPDQAVAEQAAGPRTGFNSGPLYAGADDAASLAPTPEAPAAARHDPAARHDLPRIDNFDFAMPTAPPLEYPMPMAPGGYPAEAVAPVQIDPPQIDPPQIDPQLGDPRLGDRPNSLPMVRGFRADAAPMSVSLVPGVPGAGAASAGAASAGAASAGAASTGAASRGTNGSYDALVPGDQGHVLTLIIDGVLAGVALPTGAEVTVGRERGSTLVVPEAKQTVSRRAVTLVRTARRSVEASVENRNGAWVTRQLPEGLRQEFIERGHSVTLRVGDRLALDPPGTVVVGLGEPH